MRAISELAVFFSKLLQLTQEIFLIKFLRKMQVGPLSY
jgi:hypothetical protein